MNGTMNLRYSATILVEAATPLKIGTGMAGVNVDELVATDVNGLPMIPGTALCGVLRHTLASAEGTPQAIDGKGNPVSWLDELFGYCVPGENTGQGSRIIISDAKCVGEDGQVVDGLCPVDWQVPFYARFKQLAMRDHCCINHRGAANTENRGKFDSQLVFQGTRFVFSLELPGNEEEKSRWDQLLSTLASPLFRIGGGTRKGFGKLAIVALDQDVCDLNKREDLERYLGKSSRLTIPQKLVTGDQATGAGVVQYSLALKPDDFFMFSSGFGDAEVDAVPKKELVIAWDAVGRPVFSAEKILIPATSVKGALSHRTAFHYNRLKGIFAETVENHEDVIGEKNAAVKALFGCAKNSDEGADHGQRGRVVFSDVYVDNFSEKIFNHVSIDRFTGGALDSALFDEKVAHLSGSEAERSIRLDIAVEKEALTDSAVRQAFECALADITTGMLPLGGRTTKGHGCFSGTMTRTGFDEHVNGALADTGKDGNDA